MRCTPRFPLRFCRREGARICRDRICRDRMEQLLRRAQLLARALHALARNILLVHLAELPQDYAGVEVAHLELCLEELLLAHGRHGLLSPLWDGRVRAPAGLPPPGG
jgi:hypothetical protein